MVLKILRAYFYVNNRDNRIAAIGVTNIISMVALATLVCAPVTTLAIVEIPSPIVNMLLVTARIGLDVSILVSEILILNVYSLGIP
ncbi:hypothetical protein [Shewanella benthica]|uniref:Uncharacterized protein n=1 Tax=Shewanella benthica KT99 TaxID=314608 RepID=A9DCD4_9GAMM|nr:hypothetical protein KT99_08999 [Shewanella benthica KT99]